MLLSAPHTFNRLETENHETEDAVARLLFRALNRRPSFGALLLPPSRLAGAAVLDPTNQQTRRPPLT